MAILYTQSVINGAVLTNLPIDEKTSSSTIDYYDSIVINSNTPTTQTLATQSIIGIKKTISNKGVGFAKIVASGIGNFNGMGFKNANAIYLLQNEYVVLVYKGNNNWEVLDITTRRRYAKLLNINSMYFTLGALDINGNIRYQPGARQASQGDGSTSSQNQSVRTLFPAGNANIKFTNKSVICADSCFFLDDNNTLWGFGENEAGQFNQGNATDLYQLREVLQNVVDLWYTTSPGATGYEQIALIVKTSDGHVRSSGPDNQYQAGLSSTSATRPNFVILTTGHPDSAFAFAKTVSTTSDALNGNIITITGVGQTTANLVEGQKITGTNIPANTTVGTILNSTQFTISQNATATGTSIAASFYGWMLPNMLDNVFISTSYTNFFIIWQFTNNRK
jgi:hypothetical protein